MNNNLIYGKDTAQYVIIKTHTLVLKKLSQAFLPQKMATSLWLEVHYVLRIKWPDGEGLL